MLWLCVVFIQWKRRQERRGAFGGALMALLSNLRTVFFRKIKIAERTMKIHSGTQHMRIDDKNFLARWTCNFNGLAHCLPLNHFDFETELTTNSA